jgi:hypothetical protein
MASICNICCEPHNRSTRQNVKCEYGDCGFEACKACVRQYLLSTAKEPHCMNCNKSWGQEFLVRVLNRSFVTSDYKVHRAHLLCEREISKMPETMASAERFRKVEKHEEAVKQLREQIELLKKEMAELKGKANEHVRHIDFLHRGGKKQEKRQFIMPCQSDGCRGFLSTAYKCGLCNLHTCPKCLEVVGYQKDDTHECNAESVQSAEMIRKDTKPCPSCGTRIFKIDGCDQMWCSNCHNAWSWRTGKIDTGVVHNPHYYEFQRNGGGAAARVPGDQICGGLCHYSVFRTDIVRRVTNSALIEELSNLHRLLAHQTHVELNWLRRGINQAGDNTRLRVQYIIGAMEKDALSKAVYRKDVSRRKDLEMVQVYEILNDTGVELFAALKNSDLSKGADYDQLVVEQLHNYHHLREYCNTQFEKISKIYSRTVPRITEEWKMERVKM